MKEFKNFSEYVEKLDKLYKKDYGMVKVNRSFILLPRAEDPFFVSLAYPR